MTRAVQECERVYLARTQQMQHQEREREQRQREEWEHVRERDQEDEEERRHREEERQEALEGSIATLVGEIENLKQVWGV